YDREALQREHLRAKRETLPQDQALQLDFRAFHRTFRLRLRRDITGFTEPFTVLSKNVSSTADLSHLYSGQLEDETGSTCHGSVVDSQFEGSIRTANGTYHIEPLHRYTSQSSQHHSIIYHEDDMGETTNGCIFALHLSFMNLKLYQTKSLDFFYIAGIFPSMLFSDNHVILHQQEIPVSRSKRTLDYSKTSCLLHLYADHLYFEKFKSVEAVVAQVSSYMKAINDIYNRVNFDGVKLINFKVKTLSIMKEKDMTNPLHQPFIGPEKLLNLFSESNWERYCLSYLLTNRDYSGLLGLAWEGKKGNWGGICSRHSLMRDGSNASLNTGLITLQNYGQYLPPRHVQLTLAHELGHSLGAPHDEGSNCGDLGSSGGKGRFLMFPQATNEVRENNDKFSPCSINQISQVLKVKKDDCFVVSDQPICGNQIVEEGEECDVGHNDTDLCCHSANEDPGTQCRLKPGKQCSPSQGLCCGPACLFKPSGDSCEEESDCQLESVCSGFSPVCPKPSAKANMTTCSLGTRVCLNGLCAKSLCVRYDLEQCDCLEDSRTEKCHMCCQQPDKPHTCASTTSSVLTSQFQGRHIALVPGEPCSAKQGYCDQFQVCRILDADGPIARLKNSFLHLVDLDEFEDLAEWMKVCLLLGALQLISNDIFRVTHTPDSNERLDDRLIGSKKN
uniref:ADAM10 endopeptidase n=1 Tax=Esox lucius TaxID=8010 RepID=A0A6Q2YM59_ESOLU